MEQLYTSADVLRGGHVLNDGFKIVSTGYIIFKIVLIFACLILAIIALWKLFEKAGEPGWISVIPIFNLITIFKIIGLNPLFILVYLLAYIPYVGNVISVLFTILVAYCLAKAFGKGIGFTIGLLFLSPIFLMILAFGNSEYQY